MKQRVQLPYLLTLASAALWLAVSTLSCKDGNPLRSAIEPVDAEFMATTPDPGTTERFITLDTGTADGSTVTLDLVVHDVDELVTGLAVKLKYPAGFSRFLGCSDGEIFPAGTCFAAETESGEVLLARVIAAPDEATAIPGSQVMARLEFLVFAEGVGEVSFEGENLDGGDASALLDANGDPIFMDWYAGSLAGL